MALSRPANFPWPRQPFAATFPAMSSLPAYDDLLIKRFERPDEVRTFAKGKFELVTIGGLTIGPAIYEPGWTWKESIQPSLGTPSCRVEHVGLVVQGRCACLMDDGRKYVLSPGDLFFIGPGHDAWVEGDEPYISLHFLGADSYAKR